MRPKKNHSSVEEKYADYSTDLYEVKDNQFIIAHLGTMNVFHPKLNVEGEMKGVGMDLRKKVNQGPSNLHNLLNCFSVVIQLSIVFQF